MNILKRKKQMPRPDMPDKAGSVMAAYDLMKRARKNKMSKGGEVKAGDVMDHPSDEEDRGNVLFDGTAERIDPLKKEMRENESSDHMGRTDIEEDDSAAEDIVSRIMKKMKRK